MKCTSCGNEPQTVGDIKDCKRCNKDGVAKQIPDAYPRDTPLHPVVARTNGLENRFRGQDNPPDIATFIEAREVLDANVVPMKGRKIKGLVDAAVATVKRVTKRKGAQA